LARVTCVRIAVKALCARMAPDRRRWSRWSARSEARTYDLDEPEARCRLVMGPVGDVGAPCVTWVLDEARVVGDNNRDRVSPVWWERGRVGVLRPSGASAGGHARFRSRPRVTLMLEWTFPTVAASRLVQSEMA
jgi:hypothetical protein